MITIGKVLKGQEKASGIGFPTANISNTNNCPSGIYAGKVRFGGDEFIAVIYIGERRKDILEAHLFDFGGDLYGKEIEVDVIKKLREDKVAPDLSQLKEMIKKDCNDAKEFFTTH